MFTGVGPDWIRMHILIAVVAASDRLVWRRKLLNTYLNFSESVCSKPTVVDICQLALPISISNSLELP